MKRLFLIGLLILVAGCYGRALYSTAPLQDDKAQCRSYAGGLEYCGARVAGVPGGQGTMRFPDGTEVTGRWETGLIARDAVMRDSEYIWYGHFFEQTPISSFVAQNRSTGTYHGIYFEERGTGHAYLTIDYRADGSPARVTSWIQEEGETENQVTKSVTILEEDGTERYLETINNNIHGDVLSIDPNGEVALNVFAQGVDVTEAVVEQRIADRALEIAVGQADESFRQVQSQVSSEIAESERRIAAAEDAHARTEEHELQDRIGNESLNLCVCVARKREEGLDLDDAVAQCGSDFAGFPPVPDQCSCVSNLFEDDSIMGRAPRNICLQAYPPHCYSECREEIRRRNREQAAICREEMGGLRQRLVEQTTQRARVCLYFEGDEERIRREWSHLVAELNAEIDRVIERSDQEMRASVQRAQQEIQASRRRLEAARQAREDAQRATAAQLEQERELARRQIEERTRQRAEQRQADRRSLCRRMPNHCGCGSVQLRAPSEGGAQTCMH